MVKVASISVLRSLQPGIVKQLDYEFASSKDLTGISWKTFLLTTQKSDREYSVQIPWVFRPILLRNIYGWYFIYKMSKTVDYVLVRYMLFDLAGVICSAFVKNRISVHHGKECEELLGLGFGIRGWLAYLAEVLVGRIIVSRSIGILGVTNEIAKYESLRSKKPKPLGLYLNGIKLDLVNCVPDRRQSSCVNAVMVAESFSDWHGLDILVAEASKEGRGYYSKLKIHLIGRVGSENARAIQELGDSNIFVVYGSLPSSDCRKVYEKIDFGIGSLGLHRVGLSEASSLKVREMLAVGLPVYSSHIDSGLPVDFKYYKLDKKPTLGALYEFGLKCKSDSRLVVRTSSEKYISKLSSMVNVSGYLNNLSNK